MVEQIKCYNRTTGIAMYAVLTHSCFVTITVYGTPRHGQGLHWDASRINANSKGYSIERFCQMYSFMKDKMRFSR